LCTLVFLGAPGTPDVEIWFRWMDLLDRDGLLAAYRQMPDTMPPLGAAILWVLVKLSLATGLSKLVTLRLALALAALASLVIFEDWRRSASYSLGLLLIMVFNVGLGYLDTFYLPFFLLSLREMQAGRSRISGVLFAVAALIKYQPLITLPFFIVHLWKRDRWRMIGMALPGLLVAATALAIFQLPMLMSLARALAQREISGNALNAMWLLTAFLQYSGVHGSALLDGLVHWQNLSRSYLGVALLAKVMLLATYVPLLWRLYNLPTPRLEATIAFAAAGFLCYFTFNTGVHENHLYLACVLALLASAWGASSLFMALVMIALNTVNLLVFYGLSGSGLGFDRAIGLDITVPLAAFELVLCFAYWRLVLSQNPANKLAPAAGGLALGSADASRAI
jgi:hypothetical protein